MSSPAPTGDPVIPDRHSRLVRESPLRQWLQHRALAASQPCTGKCALTLQPTAVYCPSSPIYSSFPACSGIPWQVRASVVPEGLDLGHYSQEVATPEAFDLVFGVTVFEHQNGNVDKVIIPVAAPDTTSSVEVTAYSNVL